MKDLGRYTLTIASRVSAKNNIPTLFQTHDNREHLAMMERILGPLPVRMAMKSRADKYFSSKSWRHAWSARNAAHARKHNA